MDRRKDLGPERRAIRQDAEDPDQEYEVESILDKRLFHGKLQFKIKWKEFSVEEATWEPMEVLAKCLHVLARFEERVYARMLAIIKYGDYRLSPRELVHVAVQVNDVFSDLETYNSSSYENHSRQEQEGLNTSEDDEDSLQENVQEAEELTVEVKPSSSKKPNRRHVEPKKFAHFSNYVAYDGDQSLLKSTSSKNYMESHGTVHDLYSDGSVQKAAVVDHLKNRQHEEESHRRKRQQFKGVRMKNLPDRNRNASHSSPYKRQAQEQSQGRSLLPRKKRNRKLEESHMHGHDPNSGGSVQELVHHRKKREHFKGVKMKHFGSQRPERNQNTMSSSSKKHSRKTRHGIDSDSDGSAMEVVDDTEKRQHFDGVRMKQVVQEKVDHPKKRKHVKSHREKLQHFEGVRMKYVADKISPSRKKSSQSPDPGQIPATIDVEEYNRNKPWGEPPPGDGEHQNANGSGLGDGTPDQIPAIVGVDEYNLNQAWQEAPVDDIEYQNENGSGLGYVDYFVDDGIGLVEVEVGYCPPDPEEIVLQQFY